MLALFGQLGIVSYDTLLKVFVSSRRSMQARFGEVDIVTYDTLLSSTSSRRACRHASDS